MTKSGAPSRASGADDFQIEIDPSLIEEALASVSRRLAKPERLSDSNKSDPEISIDLSLFELPSITSSVTEEVFLDLEAPTPRPDSKPAPTAKAVPEPTSGPPPAPAPIDLGTDPLGELQIRVSRAEEDRRRLLVRTADQSERLRKVEQDLARTIEARDTLEHITRDLRKNLADQVQEFGLYRARARKDADEAERRGEERVLRPIVDVYDNVIRAWKHAVSDPARILDGLQMIAEQFERLLPRLGFERIDVDRGTTFEPAWHEAVMHVTTSGLSPGLVVDEVHAGFKLRGRLFRAARVTVSASAEPT